MNNIQAIDLLRGLEQSLCDYCGLNDEGKTAFRMAIKALELFGISEHLPSAQRWIPVSERLPDEEDVPVLVTDDAGGMKTIDIDFCYRCEDTGERFWYASQNVTAWMPLPEPYGGE